MIEVVSEKISNIRADAILIEVNCVGNVDACFPGTSKSQLRFVNHYRTAFDEGRIEPGKIVAIDQGTSQTPRYVFFLPTRVHWKGERKAEYVEGGVSELGRQIVSMGIKTIAVARWDDRPGLSWTQFKLRLLWSLARIPNVRLAVIPAFESTSALKQVSIFTDGGAEPNPGPGGYGVVMRYAGQQRELLGGFQETTNNRMELMAAIIGLEALKEACHVKLYSDSRYIVDAIQTGWLFRWCGANWQGRKSKNVDLWKRLIEAYLKHEVEVYWVKGHAGIDDNERCDQLAGIAIRGDNLQVDVGYLELLKSQSNKLVRPLFPEPQNKSADRSFQSDIDSSTISRTKSPQVRGPKPKKEGDGCRYCSKPLIRRNSKKSSTTSNFYYPWHLFCDSCKRIYQVEAAKVFRKKPD